MQEVDYQNTKPGKSILNAVNVGVFAHQGARSSMEDMHRLVLWKKIKDDKTMLSIENNTILDLPALERSPKRMKQNTDFLTSSDDDAERDNENQAESFGEDVSFFLVCDGHGGIEAADFVHTYLFNKIMSQKNFVSDPMTAISIAFQQIEEEFVSLAVERELDGMVGTTVTIALIFGNTLYVANLGDSEAVICSHDKAIVITECHSTSNPIERNRIEEMGGKLISDKKGSRRLGHPIWNPHYVNIAVTRAIGDIYFKRQEYVEQKQSGLIAVPSIKKMELTHNDKFILIASDGFWDVFTPDEAVALVLKRFAFESEEICKQLVEESKQRNSKDNITVLLIKLV